MLEGETEVIFKQHCDVALEIVQRDVTTGKLPADWMDQSDILMEDAGDSGETWDWRDSDLADASPREIAILAYGDVALMLSRQTLDASNHLVTAGREAEALALAQFNGHMIGNLARIMAWLQAGLSEDLFDDLDGGGIPED
jgi:hypothetical protein